MLSDYLFALLMSSNLSNNFQYLKQICGVLFIRRRLRKTVVYSLTLPLAACFVNDILTAPADISG